MVRATGPEPQNLAWVVGAQFTPQVARRDPVDATILVYGSIQVRTRRDLHA